MLRQTFFHPTPVGEIALTINEKVIVGLDFTNGKPKAKKFTQEQKFTKAQAAKNLEGNSVAIVAKRQLDEYFALVRQSFDLPLLPIAQLSGTPFQKLVWRAIARIPYGKTKTYLEIARSIDKPKAVRAVANACGANPIAIIIPCHRVIGTGWLGGYGGGVEKKKLLLKLEKIRV